MKRPTPIGIGQHVRLRVHRGPRADGRWYWRADTAQGKRRATVWSGWGTPDEAEAATMAALRADGAAPRHEVEQVRSVLDLLDCWVASQEERRDVSPMTSRNSRAAAARLAGVIGGVRVAEVDRRVVERYRDRSGDSGATIARDLKYLRQAWRWGREVGAVVGELPSVRVQRREPVRTRYTPTRPEVAALLERVTARSAAGRRGLVLLAATGARPGELVRLRWSEVAGDCSWLEVTGKTGARRVDLHPGIAAELRAWTRDRKSVV